MVEKYTFQSIKLGEILRGAIFDLAKMERCKISILGKTFKKFKAPTGRRMSTMGKTHSRQVNL